MFKIISFGFNHYSYSILQLPEGKDNSWNFVEIDSASDLVAMENPRQSRTQVGGGETSWKNKVKNKVENPRQSRTQVGGGETSWKMEGGLQIQTDEEKEAKRVNEFQMRLNSTRSGDKKKFRDSTRTSGRRKKGRKRRVKSRSKLVRFENNEKTKEKEVSRQRVGVKNIINDNGQGSHVEMNHAKEPFLSSHHEEGPATETLPTTPEERSLGEGSTARDYYPSGPSTEQLVYNERAFWTSEEKGDLYHDVEEQKQCC